MVFVAELGQKADPEKDFILVRGKRIRLRGRYISCSISRQVICAASRMKGTRRAS